jgi:uncharacterized membrane protein
MRKNFGAELADKITKFVGSWKFILIQSTLLSIWVICNINHIAKFDPYPFILLNLFLSFQAAYATPMILMSSNRQSEKDRKQAALDLKIDEETNELLKQLIKNLNNKNNEQENLSSTSKT